MPQTAKTTSLVTVRLTPSVEAASGESRMICRRRPTGPAPEGQRGEAQHAQHAHHQLVEAGSRREGDAGDRRGGPR